MIQDTMEDARLVITKRYPIGRDVLFRMWTEPEHLTRWFSPAKEISVPVAEVDLEVGGKYRIGMRRPDKGDVFVGGIYTEIRAFERLAFTWAWEEWTGGIHDGKETLVTLDFREVNGETELTLTHENIPNRELVERHNEGWQGCLGRLYEQCAITSAQGV